MKDQKVLGGYPSSWFLAMVCPRQDAAGDSRLREGFHDVLKLDPDVMVATDKFIVHLATSQSTQIATDPRDEITLVLHGEIYNSTDSNPAKFLLEGYIRHDDSFAQDIDGSFVVLVIDKRKSSFSLITDRLNSRKVFCSQSQGTYWLSTSLNLHPTMDADIDPLGVAWYLTNGVIHNRRTVFDGIQVLQRACIHEFTENGFKPRRYWSVAPPPPESGLDETKLRAELADLMVESVRKRISSLNPRRVFLSLSAGYDSTTVLGILGYRLKVPEVRCFSYALGEAKPRTDAYIAREMATYLGYEHRTVQSYKGDLLGTITSNAAHGQGLAKFCDEVDAWLEMGNEFTEVHPSVLFVADPRGLGWTHRELNTMRDALGKVHDFEGFHWLHGKLNDDMFTTFHDGLKDEISHLINRCPSTDNLEHAREFFATERLGTKEILWRECFPGRFIPVCNPWLDNAIVEFMMKTPTSMRIDKRLYRETVTEMFPGLFQFERAEAMNYQADWGKELVSQRSVIASNILSQPSRLDSILAPELLVGLLGEHTASKARRPPPSTHDVHSSRRKPRLPRLARRLVAKIQIGRSSVEETNRTNFLMRALVIRSFLSKN